MEIYENQNTLFKNYHYDKVSYDEIIDSTGNIRSNMQAITHLFNTLDPIYLKKQNQLASSLFRKKGITFNFYNKNQTLEKIFPFDLFPRIIPFSEWQTVEAGLKQRTIALNAFLNDVYDKQLIFLNHKELAQYVLSSPSYCQQLRFISPLNKIYIHIAGIDIIRDAKGNYLVLEDNVRTPSGVSYALENRSLMKSLFPTLFSQFKINSIEEYPSILKEQLTMTASPLSEGISVLLTPGCYNSAYYEHIFLARAMGYKLVKGEDLFVENNFVYLKTIYGAKKVNVIYKRIDDEFLDPNFFNKDSLLGVPGIMQAYAAGNVVLANAVGNGIADDKAIYPFVPDMIRFYLNEEPILQQVPTFSGTNKKERQYILNNLSNLVIKVVNGSGGYGMLIGPTATKAEIQVIKEKIKANPRNYIAQPLIELSTYPTLCESSMAARRVDLRPFVITGKSQWVLPGGLTRVALKEGSYVVNSSQGGGSKDTWIVEEK